MLLPLESVSHLPDSNIFSLDHDYLLVDAGDATGAHRAMFSGEASRHSELGLALSLAFVVGAIIDASARQFHNRPQLGFRSRR
jgi:hypothetical protein